MTRKSPRDQYRLRRLRREQRASGELRLDFPPLLSQLPRPGGGGIERERCA